METNTGTVGGTEATTNETSGIKREALSIVDRGKDRVRTTVDDNKARVARTLSAVANSLKSSGAEMQAGDAAAVGGVVDRVADQIDRAATYLETSEVEDLVGGVERFARRNPALFIGAAFAVGVLGARFLKSSRTDVVAYQWNMNMPSGFGDREVATTPVGGADLATGSTSTGTVTGSSDLATGLE